MVVVVELCCMWAITHGHGLSEGVLRRPAIMVIEDGHGPPTIERASDLAQLSVRRRAWE